MSEMICANAETLARLHASQLGKVDRPARHGIALPLLARTSSIASSRRWLLLRQGEACAA
jgi:hypothetical protein